MWDRRIHQLSDKRLLVAPKEIPYNEAKLISSLLSWGFRFFSVHTVYLEIIFEGNILHCIF